MGRATRDVWEKRVERFTSSGLSAREYASELGISASALKWWKWKLSSTPSPTPAIAKPTPDAAPRPRRARKEPSAPLTFVEVKSTVVGAPAVTAPIEIVLRSGVQLRIAAGFDSPTLERVLDVMDRRS